MESMSDKKLSKAGNSLPQLLGSACLWKRIFDGNFYISCSSGRSVSGDFKSDKKHSAKWEFEYCPYCGRKIKISNNKKD